MSLGEDRRDPRAEKVYMVRCRALGDEALPALSPLKDVSRSGARFLCEQEFAVGATLEVELLLPDVRGPALVLANVVRVKKGPFGLYEYAVKFQEIGVTSRELIERAVQVFAQSTRKEFVSEHGKRRDPRAEKAFMLRYRMETTPAAHWMLSPLKDLSRSGARFLCEQKFAVGATFEVELLLPTAGHPMPLMASVVRVKEAPLGLYEHAIEFRGVDVADQKLIEKAVEYSLKQRRRRQ